MHCLSELSDRELLGDRDRLDLLLDSSLHLLLRTDESAGSVGIASLACILFIIDEIFSGTLITLLIHLSLVVISMLLGESFTLRSCGAPAAAAFCSAGPAALTSSCGSCCSAALSGSCAAACKTALLTGFLTAARAETALVAGSVVSARSALLASVLAEAALFTGSLTAICAEAALVAGPLTAICAETALVAGSLAASSAEAALLALAVSVSLESALVIAVVAIVTAALAGLLSCGAFRLILARLNRMFCRCFFNDRFFCGFNFRRSRTLYRSRLLFDCGRNCCDDLFPDRLFRSLFLDRSLEHCRCRRGLCSFLHYRLCRLNNFLYNRFLSSCLYFHSRDRSLFNLLRSSDYRFRLVEVHFHLCGLYTGTNDLVRNRLSLCSRTRGPGVSSCSAGLARGSLLSCSAAGIGSRSTAAGVRSAGIGTPLSGTLTALIAVSRHDNDLFLLNRSLAVGRSGPLCSLSCFFVLICT